MVHLTQSQASVSAASRVDSSPLSKSRNSSSSLLAKSKAEYEFRLLQIHVLYANEPVAKHVNARLTLRQDAVTNQGFVLTVNWIHFDKRYLAMDWTETFYLNAHWSANFSASSLLISRV